MPRGKRAETIPPKPDLNGNGIGHKSKVVAPEPLTDDQSQALFFSHKRKYETALAKKKEADAAFKNACKLAKSELGDDAVASIKDAILLDSEEGEAKLRKEIERQMRVARWMNVPFGAQTDLFTDVTDRRPATERAFAEGKKAGLAGETGKPPHDPSVPQFQSWMDGWHDGQKALFQIQRTTDAAAFDQPEQQPEAA